MFVLDSQCERCRHLRKSPARTCDAYPAGIPPEMSVGDIDEGAHVVDHRRPHAGDQGIRFEALPGQHHPLAIMPR